MIIMLSLKDKNQMKTAVFELPSITYVYEKKYISSLIFLFTNFALQF